MLPEDPECPYYLKLVAIAELESQIERIKDSMDNADFWIKEEERRGS